MLFSTPTLDDRELRVCAQIDDARKQLRHQLHEPRRWVGSLRRLSFARALQGSNSIEGYDAALDDAAAVAVGEDPLDASTETTLALEGYRDAMTYVLQLATDDEFTYSTQLLKSLHFMMTSYSLQNRPGQWRTGTVYIRNEGTGDIVYEGPDIQFVPELMKELASSLNSTIECDSIVAAAMAHLNLVMVHPFRDGNGRMARCLQSLVLARNGVLSPIFMSIEEYLGRNTLEYYDVLARVGQGSWSPESDARPWIRVALKAHLRQARTLLQRVADSERLWLALEELCNRHSLPDRTLTALFDAASGLRIRNATYRANLIDTDEEITEQTASRDLRLLTDRGLLIAKGERRGRFYVGSDELDKIQQAVRMRRDRRDDTDPFAD